MVVGKNIKKDEVKKPLRQASYAKRMEDKGYLYIKRWVHESDIEEFDRLVNSLPSRQHMNKG